MDNMLGVDWRTAWLEYNRTRRPPDDSSYWDGRAKSFSYYAGTSLYTEAFISYLGLSPAQGPQSFLDMGSGSGTLAIPLARAGHTVLAADFSPKMLGELEASAQQEGLETIRTTRLDFNASWEEWEKAGITEDCVDIALASRSTMVADLGDAFEKLERAARVKVAVTLATEFGPREIRRMGASVDGGPSFIPDYIFATNVLFQMGRYPELRFIDSPKKDSEGVERFIRWAFLSWPVAAQSS
jgi:SAM-dependent methyltransferase